MNPKKYKRKPFTVTVMEVTEDNLQEVADWCGGSVVKNDEDNSHSYIRVKVYRPVTKRQEQAFVHDLVIKIGKGFKVYTRGAFDRTFEEVVENG